MEEFVGSKRPHILIITNDGVDQACLHNGLSFAQLIQPFLTIRKVNHRFRTITGHSDIKDVSFRAVDSSTIQQESVESMDGRMRTIVNENPPMLTVEEMPLERIESRKEVREHLDMPIATQLPTQWFEKFREELMGAMNCQDTDMFGQPIAVFIIASSGDKNPVSSFSDLSNPRNWPEPFAKKRYSTKIPHFFFLLHDVCAHQSINPHESIKAAKSHFGANVCHVLQVNSLPPDCPRTEPVSNYRKFGQVQPPVGRLLSDEDLNGLRLVMERCLLNGVLPAVEQSLMSQHQHITAHKKGFKNALKSWWRKPKENVSTGSGKSQGTYPCTSIESQMRQFADLSFLFGDYTSAASMYRLVRDDFKSDRANPYVAACGLMTSICDSLSGYASLDETASAIHRAGVLFVRSAPRPAVTNPHSPPPPHPFKRAGTICNIMACSLMLDKCQQMEMSAYQDPSLLDVGTYNQYMRTCAEWFTNAASEESHLVSGLLMEAAAGCHIRTSPSCLYKFGFASVMAGYLLVRAGLNTHGLRCYYHSFGLYEEKNWDHIEDHIRGAIARELGDLKHHGAGFRMMLPVVASRKGSSTHQRQRIERCAALYQGDSNKDPNEFVDMTVPSINCEKIRSLVWRNPSKSAVPETYDLEDNFLRLLWTMKQDITAYNRGTLSPVELVYTSPSLPPYKMSSGECVTLDIPLENPLDVPLILMDLKPFCMIINENGDEEEVDTQADLTWMKGHDILQPCFNDHVQATSGTIQLEARQNLTLRLHIVPSKPGQLVIKSLRYSLNGIIPSQIELECVGPLLHDTREQRAARSRQPDTRLSIPVRAEAPWLEIDIETFPIRMQQWQLVESSIRIHNHGTSAAHRIIVQHNGAFDMIIEGAENEGEQGQCIAIPLPKDGLKSGEEITVPVCFHSFKSGTIKPEFVFVYDDKKPKFDGIKGAVGLIQNPHHRLACLSYSTTVLASAQVSNFVRPLGPPGKWLLGLQLKNCRQEIGDTSFSAIEAVSHSRQWVVKPFCSNDLDCKIDSGEVATHLFVLEQKNDSSIVENRIPLTNIEENTDISPSLNQLNFLWRLRYARAQWRERQRFFYQQELLAQAGMAPTIQSVRKNRQEDLENGVEVESEVKLPMEALALKKLGKLTISLILKTSASFQSSSGTSKEAICVLSKIGLEVLPPELEIGKSPSVPFSLHCDYDDVVHNDFDQNTFAQIPVTYEITHCARGGKELEVNVEIGDSKVHTGPEMASSVDLWMGPKSQRFIMPAGSSEKLPIVLWLPRAGVYSCPLVSLTISIPGKPHAGSMKHIFRKQHLITMKETVGSVCIHGPAATITQHEETTSIKEVMEESLAVNVEEQMEELSLTTEAETIPTESTKSEEEIMKMEENAEEQNEDEVQITPLSVHEEDEETEKENSLHVEGQQEESDNFEVDRIVLETTVTEEEEQVSQDETPTSKKLHVTRERSISSIGSLDGVGGDISHRISFSETAFDAMLLSPSLTSTSSGKPRRGSLTLLASPANTMQITRERSSSALLPELPTVATLTSNLRIVSSPSSSSSSESESENEGETEEELDQFIAKKSSDLEESMIEEEKEEVPNGNEEELEEQQQQFEQQQEEEELDQVVAAKSVIEEQQQLKQEQEQQQEKQEEIEEQQKPIDKEESVIIEEEKEFEQEQKQQQEEEESEQYVEEKSNDVEVSVIVVKEEELEEEEQQQEQQQENKEEDDDEENNGAMTEDIAVDIIEDDKETLVEHSEEKEEKEEVTEHQTSTEIELKESHEPLIKEKESEAKEKEESIEKSSEVEKNIEIVSKEETTENEILNSDDTQEEKRTEINEKVIDEEQQKEPKQPVATTAEELFGASVKELVNESVTEETNLPKDDDKVEIDIEEEAIVNEKKDEVVNSESKAIPEPVNDKVAEESLKESQPIEAKKQPAKPKGGGKGRGKKGKRKGKRR